MATITGGAKLEAYLRKMSEKVARPGKLQVGFMENATYPDGTSVPMVAAIQEFGAPGKGIPPRPFMRPVVAEHAAEWGAGLGPLLKAADYDAPLALARLGLRVMGDIHKKIVETTSPPLSPVTLLLRERFGNHPEQIKFSDVQKARGDIASGRKPKVTGTHAKPLVWTGHLLNSLTSRVTVGGKWD